MKKLLKNPGTSYITINSIDLTLSPQESYELSNIEKVEWVNDNELLEYIRSGAIQVGYWQNSFYTNPIDGEMWFRSLGLESFTIANDSTSLIEFQNAIVEDSETNIKSTTILTNLMLLMRELYNDPSNPFYVESFQPFIGSSGREVEHLARTTNLENIHSKTGWHSQEIKSYGAIAPFDTLFYYGWLNSFNSSTNSWNNELVAQDMAKYNIIILGDGIQLSTHGDYSNTTVIIPRIKALNPNVKIFGYVATTETLTDFQTKVDAWEDLEIDGIFMDEAGYDYGTNRTDFNTRVDYVHEKTYANLCFVNSWNMDHIIGTTDDVSYPNTTWNVSLTQSNLTSSDWYLLESFPINTDSYTNGYESVSDWASRGTKAISHRSTYGINLASMGIINNSNTNGQNLFEFLYVSALMFGLEAVGSSDSYYGASSAAVTFWTRPSIYGLGRIWTTSPSVQVKGTDSNIYNRYVDFGRLDINFTSGYESGYIYKNAGMSSGISGYSGMYGISGYSGVTGYSGYSGYNGVSSSSYYLSSNFTTTSTSASATNLQFTMDANTTYIVEINLTAQCSGNGGCKFSISVGTSNSGVTIEGWVNSNSSSTTAFRAQRVTTLDTLMSTAVHTSSSTPLSDNIIFTINNGSTSQTCRLNAASNTSGQTTTIFAGSNMRISKATSL